MIYGIFAGHDDFPNAIVKSCESIIGNQGNYSVISNRDLSNEDIYKNFENIIKSHQDHKEFFLFVDFYGSSISLPAFRIKQNSNKTIKLIFGYNLPMVIDFFLHRNKMESEQLFEKIIEIGRKGIR
ncbi:MAG: hypothetical protein QME48_03765 [bacterium]|uniref:PTS system fructose subfamily IIA component n=2 Tax=Bacteria candidate phyla TaxID=1783234 RepID=A0A101I1Y2_UNCT6|nr:MAG: PTS system fructose subfamily IIA component [candidate division TA06 bacterium 32_111]KUK87516.1 MAG: PTS system fructose subfamily IIA component [candidate division TA06 bacterium 34_109]MDI6700330.1 hypothetical protein [bacterium]HAF08148.1 hypothetical protein [candidate division WOR-3 bacterium]HCP16710.1 hypothetical protein [candidate division WOR-3 bacterium]